MCSQCEAACLSVSTPQSIKPNMKGIRRVIFLTCVSSVYACCSLRRVIFQIDSNFSLAKFTIDVATPSCYGSATLPVPKYFAFFFLRTNKSTIPNYIRTDGAAFCHFFLSLSVFSLYFSQRTNKFTYPPLFEYDEWLINFISYLLSLFSFRSFVFFNDHRDVIVVVYCVFRVFFL